MGERWVRRREGTARGREAVQVKSGATRRKKKEEKGLTSRQSRDWVQTFMSQDLPAEIPIIMMVVAKRAPPGEWAAGG